MSVEIIKNNYVNKNVVEILEEVLLKARQGIIVDVAVSYVTNEQNIGGEVSSGEDKYAMHSSIVHLNESFYDQHFRNGGR